MSKKQISKTASEYGLEGAIHYGPHSIPPISEQSSILARANQINNSAGFLNSNQQMFALNEGNGRVVCQDSLEDMHCYADACAAELGGNIAMNYMQENVDPRNPEVGNVIETFWNG